MSVLQLGDAASRVPAGCQQVDCLFTAGQAIQFGKAQFQNSTQLVLEPTGAGTSWCWDSGILTKTGTAGFVAESA